MDPKVEGGIHHVSFLVRDTKRALEFYNGVLRLEVDIGRPHLGFPGAWLDLGQGQQIHLLELPSPDPQAGRPAHGGRDRHVALCVKDLDVLVSVLDAKGFAYTRSSSGRQALFCRDPDGNALEFIQTG